MVANAPIAWKKTALDLAKKGEPWLTRAALRAMFGAMDLKLRLDPGYRALAKGWKAKIRLDALDGSLGLLASVGDGRVRCRAANGEAPDVTMRFRDAAAARALLTKSPSAVLDMLLDGGLVFSGNMSHVARLSFMLTTLAGRRDGHEAPPWRDAPLGPPRRSLAMERCDEVRHLEDPGLSRYTLDDFPRLRRFLVDHFAITPEICTERPLLYTAWMRVHGFEKDADGRPHHPALRQAGAFHHLMTHRAPLIHEGDLLAGTTTTKDIGVVIYPECGGIPIWPELNTVSRRKLNPYRVAPEDARILNDEVFPFWMDRNVREVARAEGKNPLSIQLDERFVLYFQWKTQAVSHTIPDFPSVLGRGLASIRDDARARGEALPAEDERRPFYQAVALSLDGVLGYAARLSKAAAAEARASADPARRAELEEIARICAKVPAGPAETLHEALQSMWITWVACHMENTNAGLSIGRVDQWLQPYFEADWAKLPDDEAAREAYLRRAIELVGCFFMRCTDHLPQVADLGNKLFGGSSSDQVITLGGVRPDGSNGVNDMTYICLKVTEMLGVRDPNVNARYHEGVNSPEYLRRLCEVNVLTHATPSIHNDASLIDVLRDQGLAPEHARDWSATGCVEPTSCGRHYGHTNCMMFNLVAPLEMALRDGVHPVVGEQIGPHTGDPRSFESFDALLGAYFAQLENLIRLACEANNLLGRAHQIVRPTPFLSALIDGPLDKGIDLSAGGARYNSSGSGNVGLVDVVDSLMAMKRLVFEEKRVSMDTFLAAIEADFAGHEALLARIESKVPKFGSGAAEPHDLAGRLIAFCHETFRAQPHYRGGHYNSGFWSMSNHVAFGMLSGALPSGRRKGKAFTPGLTPAPSQRASLTDQIRDVASLDHHAMPNNIAFNVKVVPGPGDSRAETLDQMAAYARAYVQEGGMQLQFNVVSSETLREAMKNPDAYRWLVVRISGYNAYFVDLNDDMKRELIERAEHQLAG